MRQNTFRFLSGSGGTDPTLLIVVVYEEDTGVFLLELLTIFCIRCAAVDPVIIPQRSENVGQFPGGGITEGGEGAQQQIGLRFIAVRHPVEEGSHAECAFFLELKMFCFVHFIQQGLCFGGGLRDLDRGERRQDADPAFHILLPDFDRFGIGEDHPAAQFIFINPPELVSSRFFPFIPVMFLFVSEETHLEVGAEFFPFVIPLCKFHFMEITEGTEDVEEVFIRCGPAPEKQIHQQARVRGEPIAFLNECPPEEGEKGALLLCDRDIMLRIFQIFQECFGFSGSLRRGQNSGPVERAAVKMVPDADAFAVFHQLCLLFSESFFPLLNILRDNEIRPQDQLLGIDSLKTECGFRCHLPICLYLIVPQEADNVPESICRIHSELAPFPFVFPVEQPQEDTVLIFCRGPDRLCAQPEKQIELVRIPERVVMEEGEQPEPALFFCGRNFVKTVLEKPVECIGMKIFLSGLFEV